MNIPPIHNFTLLGSPLRLEVLIEYSFFSEVVMVTFELLDDTTWVLVDNLATLAAGELDSLD